MTPSRLIAPLVAMAALSACGAAVPPPKTAPAAVRPAPNPYLGAGPGAPVELAGKDARALGNLFGKPRLDVREGAGRKLQFVNDRCVLDAYLYAPRAGSEAVVTYAEARDRAGIDMPASSCSALLRR